MSKKSVFKFKIINPGVGQTINYLMNNYFVSKNMKFSQKDNCYVIGNPDEKKANENVMNAIINRNADVPNNNFPCLEYQVIENQLIIKAYTLNSFSGIKVPVHYKLNSNLYGKEFYNDLKTRLFSVLERNGITLISTEVEKVKDGSNSKLMKKLLLYTLPIIIIFAIIVFIVYKSSN